MRSAPYAFGLAAAFVLSGCAVVVASSVVADKSRTTASHEQFTQGFKGENLARRTQGLPELDLCSELYWSDRGWAMKDRACKRRIVRWENGDSTALNPKGMVLVTTVAVAPDSIQKVYDKLQEHKDREAWKYRGPGQ